MELKFGIGLLGSKLRKMNISIAGCLDGMNRHGHTEPAKLPKIGRVNSLDRLPHQQKESTTFEDILWNLK